MRRGDQQGLHFYSLSRNSLVMLRVISDGGDGVFATTSPSLKRGTPAFCGSKGHLSRRVNCEASNAGTGGNSRRGRSADDQCCRRGRRVVVVSERVMPLTKAKDSSRESPQITCGGQTGRCTTQGGHRERTTRQVTRQVSGDSRMR